MVKPLTDFGLVRSIGSETPKHHWKATSYPSRLQTLGFIAFARILIFPATVVGMCLVYWFCRGAKENDFWYHAKVWKVMRPDFPTYAPRLAAN